MKDGQLAASLAAAIMISNSSNGEGRRMTGKAENKKLLVLRRLYN
jgi:hypothetical protein